MKMLTPVNTSSIFSDTRMSTKQIQYCFMYCIVNCSITCFYRAVLCVLHEVFIVYCFHSFTMYMHCVIFLGFIYFAGVKYEKKRNVSEKKNTIQHTPTTREKKEKKKKK